MGQTAFALGSGLQQSCRWAGAGVRVSIVVAAHIAVIIGLAQLHPQLNKPIEPVFVRLITPPQPEPEPSPALQVRRAEPVPKPVARAPQAAAAAKPPALEPRVEPTPPITSGEAAIAVAPAVAASAEPVPQSTAAGSPAPIKPKPPAPVIAPRFDVAYLNNPRPVYPRMARRLGEQGRVVLHVFVTAAGRAEKVEIRTSSGSPRLDQAARDAVQNWTFIPARQGDEPVGAWVLVPVSFVLEG